MSREKLIQENPHLVVCENRYNSHVIAAKNIKRELKKAFPNFKFSVRSESFAGGDSVHVSWVDGPTRKEVDTIIDKYQEGSFDGMYDIYEYNTTEWNNVFGGAKYVSSHREVSKEKKIEVCQQNGIEFVDNGEYINIRDYNEEKRLGWALAEKSYYVKPEEKPKRKYTKKVKKELTDNEIIKLITNAHKTKFEKMGIYSLN